MSPETREVLRGALRSNSIFLGFSEAQLDDVLNSVRLMTCSPGEQIIQKGTIGDKVCDHAT